MCMKKTLMSIVSAVLLTVGFGAQGTFAEKVEQPNNPKLEAEIAQLEAELFEDNKVGVALDDVGHIILDRKGNTVVGKVTKKHKDGSSVTNVFDSNDNKIFIDQKYKKGTILLITFDGDQIIKVKKNNLSVANKVIGQKYNKKVDVFTYKITKVKGNNVYGKAISDISKKNKGVVLSKKQFRKGKVSKGDKVLVTFAKGSQDDIKKVQKLKY